MISSHILCHTPLLDQSRDNSFHREGAVFWYHSGDDGPETVQATLGTVHMGHPQPPSFLPFPTRVVTSDV